MNCRAVYREAKLSRIIRDTLEQTQYTCLICKQPYPYSDILKHQKECNLAGVACVLECREDLLLFGSVGVRDHFKADCTKINLRCNRCKGAETRLTIDQHDCVSALLTKIKTQDETITALNKIVKSLIIESALTNQKMGALET